MESMVSLADYEGLNGFGGGSLGSAEILEDLNKAISTGYDISSQTGGAALRPQSLESTLKVLTFHDQHVKLWKKINKIPAYSTAEEYNRLTEYGENSGGFFQEGGLPREEDTEYSRQVALVKFLGTTRVNLGSLIAKVIRQMLAKSENLLMFQMGIKTIPREG
jgi:hypothetical protein